MLASIDKDARNIAALQEKNKRLESEMHELRTAISTLSLRMNEELQEINLGLRNHEDKLLDTNTTSNVYLLGPSTIKKNSRNGRELLDGKVLAKITLPLKTEQCKLVVPCDQEFYIVNDENTEVRVVVCNGSGLTFGMDDPVFENCYGFAVPAKKTFLLPKASICFWAKDILDHSGRRGGEILYDSSLRPNGTRFHYTLRCQTKFPVDIVITDDDGRIKRIKKAKPICLNWRIEVVKPEEIPLPNEIPWGKEIDPLNLVGKHIFYKSGASSEPLSGVVVAYNDSENILCIDGVEFIDLKFWFISLQSPPNAVWFAPMK